jgi:phospho-N-acetylmuramoyl-pentapeptide-transferase
MEKIFGFAILSFFISAMLLIPFIDFLYKFKFQRQVQETRDPMNKRTPEFDKMSKWKVGTPIGGGLLIIGVVTVLTLWAYGLFGVEVKFWELFVLLFAFIGFGLLGFYDDLKKTFKTTSGFFGLRFRQKFLIQWALAIVIGLVFYFKLGYSFIYIHWIGQIPLGILFVFLAAFVVVSFANAMNIIDGLDGLASGVFLINLMAFLVISHSLLDNFLVIFIAILLGAVLAFLYFNVFPARIWLGDVGSLSLGAVLAVIGLLTGKVTAVAAIGGVFVIEIASSMIQLLAKKYLGRRILPIAPLHLYFQKKGWEEPKIVMRAWMIAILFALIGLYIAFVQ